MESGDHGRAQGTRIEEVGGDGGAVRDRVRQRRLIHLLRAGPGRGARPRPHPGRLHLRRRPLRADRQDLRGGRVHVPRGGRLLLLRPSRLQRGRLLLRRLGTVTRLHHHRRDQRLLRAALPGGVLARARSWAVGRGRGRRGRGDPGAAQHPRSGGIDQAQHRPRADGPDDADRAGRAGHHRHPRPRPDDPPGPPRGRAELHPAALRRLDLDDRLHRDRDRLQHGRGGEGPRRAGAAHRQLRADRGDRPVRGHLDHRDVRTAGDAERGRPLLDRPGDDLQGRPGAGDRLGPAPARDDADGGPLLHRSAGGDHPDHRHQRRA